MMSTLSQLKFTQFSKPTQVSSAEHRRGKLLRKLREQMALAEAVESGSHYAPTKTRIVVDAETGVRRTVSVPKRVKAWWTQAEGGKITLSVRYGSKLLEFGKNKTAIEVGSGQQLVPTIQLVCDAVAAGELDAQLEAASARLKAGFKR
jgi:hypothetical protein